ncbi:MAG: hypothetical protein ACTHPS_22655 [Streptosporangiaceae bacterium]
MGRCYGIVVSFRDLWPAAAPGYPPARPPVREAGQLIIALALLAIVSTALGLFISASVNTSGKTMPILMVVVVVEVIHRVEVIPPAGCSRSPRLLFALLAWWRLVRQSQAPRG